MKTKIWVGVLFYSFMGCANKAPKSNLTSKSIPKEPEGYGVRYIPHPITSTIDISLYPSLNAITPGVYRVVKDRHRE